MGLEMLQSVRGFCKDLHNFCKARRQKGPTKLPHGAAGPEVYGQQQSQTIHSTWSTTRSETLSQDDTYAKSSTLPCSETHPELPGASLPIYESSQSGDIPFLQKYYDQEPERDMPMPKKIPCYLEIIFNAKRLSKRHFLLDWQNDNSYQIVENAAAQCLRTDPESICKEQRSLTYGVCRLFKRRQEVASATLESKDQWFEVLHLAIARFLATPGNEYAKFHLKITWIYTGTAVDSNVNEAGYSRKIANLISDGMTLNWPRQKKFIPRRALDAIIKQNVVEHLIAEDQTLQNIGNLDMPSNQHFGRQQLIRKITEGYIPLLALFVSGQVPLIWMWRMLHLDAGGPKLPLDPAAIPANMDSSMRSHIIDNQWAFIAHKFPRPSGDRVHCISFEDDPILPIAACGQDKPIGEGSSGIVFEVQIPPGHHRFTGDKKCAFALKQFKNDRPSEDFQRETEVLRKLLDVPHDHITPPLASWSQAKRFYMLSPLASCNLTEYWERNEPQLDDAEFVLWVLTELCGLADGLRLIYNLGGWHHDLKGENVLVFTNGSGRPTLKITDFGSAKIRDGRSSGPQDISSPTKNVYQGTHAYEAPDYYINKETSRPYDVWTMGCIFMGMLIWMFKSCPEMPSSLGAFSDERRQLGRARRGNDTMFWHVMCSSGRYTTHWKPAVQARLEKLESLCMSNKGRTIFRELVLTTRKMLRMDPSKRPKPYEVHNDLERMTLWARENVEQANRDMEDPSTGTVPSTARSEASGKSDSDDAPVYAPWGHLMHIDSTLPEMCRVNHLQVVRSHSRSGYDVHLAGTKDNLQHDGNIPDRFRLVVDGVDGSPSDHDVSDEAQTAVQSEGLSEEAFMSDH